MAIRINKYLSEVGYCSRRGADRLIEEGKVIINNEVAEIGSKVNEGDYVEVEGRRIEKLKKRYTLGNLNFDSIIISDFDESLKSVTTSLLYTDVLPKNKFFITLNQWFDESLMNETDIQPLYYPSINKENFDAYKIKFPTYLK